MGFCACKMCPCGHILGEERRVGGGGEEVGLALGVMHILWGMLGILLGGLGARAGLIGGGGNQEADFLKEKVAFTHHEFFGDYELVWELFFKLNTFDNILTKSSFLRICSKNGM